MKTRVLSISLATAVALVLTTRSALTTQITYGLYNTGVNDGGQVLPDGTVDRHYAVYGASDAAYVHPIVYHYGDPQQQAWVTPPPGSAWIGPDPTGSIYPNDPAGDYFYFLKFSLDLSAFSNPSNVHIVGSWATDNGSSILLNGQATGYTKGLFGFTQLDPFDLTGFRSGLNDIEFLVNNESGPSGLLVAGLMLVYPEEEAGPTVPEASSAFEGLLMLGLPLMILGIARRRIYA